MDQFIKLLLEKENNAILPGFGAIVIENENTGKLMFNEYLKFNDGKLDAIIVENSMMELQDAQNYVAKNVREIMQTIDKGDTYDIFNLGSFSKDEDGSIVFEGSLSGYTSSEQKEDPTKEASEEIVPAMVEPKEAEEITSQAVLEKEEETPSTPEKNEPSSSTEPIEEKPIEPQPTEKEKNEHAVESIKEDSSTSKQEVPTKEEDKKDENDKKSSTKTSTTKKKEKTKSTAMKTAKPKKEKGEKKKKKGVFFWILILLLLLVGTGSVLIALNYDKVKTYMGWDEFEEVKNIALKIDEEDEVNLEEGLEKAALEEELNEDENNEVAEEGLSENETSIENDNMSSETTPSEDNSTQMESSKEKAVEEEKAEATPQPKQEKKNLAPSTSGSGSYHLIAGTFSSRENAEKLVEDLKAKGHPAAIIGKFNGLNYVSVQGFATSTEARDNVGRVQQDAPGAWIYKQP